MAKSGLRQVVCSGQLPAEVLCFTQSATQDAVLRSSEKTEILRWLCLGFPTPMIKCAMRKVAYISHKYYAGLERLGLLHHFPPCPCPNPMIYQQEPGPKGIWLKFKNWEPSGAFCTEGFIFSTRTEMSLKPFHTKIHSG